MSEGDPYPVKGFFALANNTLMSFANTRRIYEALMKQDLLVVYEHMMTPTAQLADYVLPGDSWLERPSMMAGLSDKAMNPPGDCKSIVYFWKQLAERMNMGEYFPWYNEEELLDYRLEPGRTTWKESIANSALPKSPYEEKKYLRTGFATPSGKVELYSSILDDLGFDPLPYYREATSINTKYPLSMFIGLPDDEYYRTGHRHIPELRSRAQDPTFFISNEDAADLMIIDGDWTRVVTRTGSMLGRVFVRSSMPKGLVRVPHGWWKPESAKGLENMSGMWSFSDAQLTADDDPNLIDLEQGIPHLKGVPCYLAKLIQPEVKVLEEVYGPTDNLLRGPEGKVLRSDARKDDFMYDEEFGRGIEFDAIELSLYGRRTS